MTTPCPHDFALAEWCPMCLRAEIERLRADNERLRQARDIARADLLWLMRHVLPLGVTATSRLEDSKRVQEIVDTLGVEEVYGTKEALRQELASLKTPKVGCKACEGRGQYYRDAHDTMVWVQCRECKGTGEAA